MATKREKQLAIVLFGLRIERDDNSLPARAEVESHLRDHVLDRQSVEPDNILRVLKRLLEAIR